LQSEPTPSSSSIALTQATHGNALNIVEKNTRQLLPLSDRVFATFAWLPTLLIVVIMPIVFIAIRPADADVTAFVPEPEAPPAAPDLSDSIARRMDRSPVGSLFLLAAGLVDGSSDGRAGRQHAAAVLGAADGGDGRDRHPARDGLHRRHLRGHRAHLCHSPTGAGLTALSQ